LLKFPVIAIASGIMILILCYGLLNMKPWARALAMMLLGISLIGSLYLFVTFVMRFVSNPVNNITFILILIGIGLNIYLFMWFFERKREFN
jgi:hypothetical protein